MSIFLPGHPASRSYRPSKAHSTPSSRQLPGMRLGPPEHPDSPESRQSFADLRWLAPSRLRPEWTPVRGIIAPAQQPPSGVADARSGSGAESPPVCNDWEIQAATQTSKRIRTPSQPSRKDSMAEISIIGQN